MKERLFHMVDMGMWVGAIMLLAICTTVGRPWCFLAELPFILILIGWGQFLSWREQ